MKRSILSAVLLLSLAIAAGRAEAEPFELAFAVDPTFLQDTRYEAFSSGDLSLPRFGVDARFGAGKAGRFEFLPLVGYRFGRDRGNPFGVIETELSLHELALGLRVRRELFDGLAIFAEVDGAVVWAALDATQDAAVAVGGGALGTRRDYRDRRTTWSATGLAGLELAIPRRWLASRKVEKFGFGGEIGIGYVGRGEVRLAPKLEAGADNAIPAQTAAWGDVDLSGWFLRIGVAFRFF